MNKSLPVLTKSVRVGCLCVNMKRDILNQHLSNTLINGIWIDQSVCRIRMIKRSYPGARILIKVHKMSVADQDRLKEPDQHSTLAQRPHRD